jgi:ParB family chromosome partitioning protein
MGKLDELRRLAVGNVDESMGGSPPPMHGVSAAGPRPVPARLQGLTRQNDVAQIPLDKIDRDPNQPREEFDKEALRCLAESFKARGQLQPIRVRWDEGRGVYVILCGERRWRAARMAGLPTMSCIIVDRPLDPGELLAIQLVENCLREDLKPIEQAKAFKSLMETNSWSGNQLARELAIPQPSVVRALRLLELPGTVQDQVEQGALPPATAYEIGKLADPDEQCEVAARAVAEGISRADVITEVHRRQNRSTTGAAKVTRPRPAKVEFKGPKGTVVVTAATPGDVVAILKWALKEAQAAARGVPGGGAEAA